MDKTELNEILVKHSKWLMGQEDGKQANFRCADLRKADFSGADLCKADFRCANLRGADFSGADLRKTDFRGVDLRKADFLLADLRWADLRCANLRGADFSGADLRKTDFRGADLLETKIDYKLEAELLEQVDEESYKNFWDTNENARSWLEGIRKNNGKL